MVSDGLSAFFEFEGFLKNGCAELLDQNSLGIVEVAGGEDEFLVIDKKEPAAPARDPGCVTFFDRGPGFRSVGTGQVEVEGRAITRTRVDFEEALGAYDCFADNGEAEAGAFAWRFRRKKGIHHHRLRSTTQDWA